MFARHRPRQKFSQETPSKNIRKTCASDMPKSPEALGLASARDVQNDAKPELLRVTGQFDYQGACPLHEITLKAIHSYSYREDSTAEAPTLYGCVEPRKSPS